MESRFTPRTRPGVVPQCHYVAWVSRSAAHPGALSLAACAASYDRFVIGPLLVLLALAWDQPLTQAVLLAVGHQVAYGVGQPVWGALSDRIGRMRVIRISLLLGGVAALASVAAWSFATLLVARVVAGAAFGAVAPAVMSHLGDSVAPEQRSRALAGFMRSIAIGTASATALSGVIGQFLGWRVALGVPLVLAAAALVALRGLSEGEHQGVSLRASLPGLRHPEVLIILGLTTLEGALVLGTLQLIPTALQDGGAEPGLAGLAAALYGIGVIVASGIVGRLPVGTRTSRTAMIGAAALVAAGLVLTVRLDVFGAALACTLIALTWSFMHNALQTWLTDIEVPGRGLVVAFFAGALFLGSALGTWLAAGWVEAQRWQDLAVVMTVLAALLGVGVVAGRVRAETRASPGA